MTAEPAVCYLLLINDFISPARKTPASAAGISGPFPVWSGAVEALDSMRLLRQEFLILKRRLPTLWTNSYFVSTVGGAPLTVVKQYIENQKGY